MNARPSERHLIVFVKAPRLGRVKRRLAAGIGPVAALGFHRANVRRLLAGTARDPRWTTWLAIAPDLAAGLDRVWPHVQHLGGRRFGQGRGGIGERMDRALRRVPPGPAVLVGGDVPGIEPPMIERAFRALGTTDFVFGPAEDGGFWLIGARRGRRFPNVMTPVRWSTEFTLSDTLRNVETAAARYRLVEALADVDDPAAYANWLRRRAASRAPAGGA